MIKNKYLDDLGIPQNQYGTNFCDERTDKRAKRWEEQKKIYGFDDRETWNLNTIFVEWLYSRLMMYKEEASKIVDLTFYKFTWKEKEVTQIEAIDILIEECKFYLLNCDETDKEKEAVERIQEAIKLWADIFPCMWW